MIKPLISSIIHHQTETFKIVHECVVGFSVKNEERITWKMNHFKMSQQMICQYII